MAESKRVICAATDLTEGGRAIRFSIQQSKESVSCFTVRFDGAVYAYVNCCPHRGTELDWRPGEVFDQSGLYLICATHGAMFDPTSGECIAGPCLGARLTALPIEEQDGVIALARHGQS
jgi:nitrite reductase/ring-hydroxylating ferredoxin subunit